MREVPGSNPGFPHFFGLFFWGTTITPPLQLHHTVTTHNVLHVMLRSTSSAIRCVIFDLGGVVFSSPIGRLRVLECQKGIPLNALNKYIAHATSWKELEKGTISPAEFISSYYDDELKEKAAAIDSSIDPSLLRVSGRDIMDSILSPDAWTPRAPYVEATKTLRSSGFKVVGLTNNFKSDPASPVTAFDIAAPTIHDMFDLVVESSKVNLRKPSLEIYRYTCSKAGVEPSHCAFLDDIGPNLKPARELGMRTIRVNVEDTHGVQALLALEDIVGVSPLFATDRPKS